MRSKVADRILSKTPEETKTFARLYGDSIIHRKEGYYWCKLNRKWDIFYWCENWYDGMQNSYKETDFDEIDECILTHPQ